MRNRLDVFLSAEAATYFTCCARIRNMNRTTLLRRMLEVIAKDMLVAGILDDADDMKRHRPGCQKFKEPLA